MAPISPSIIQSGLNVSNATTSGVLPNPVLLTPNAIYGIMAMVGLICLIFGFWCGKNCSTHSISTWTCKLCVFWCDDEFVDEDDYDEDESAWNWKMDKIPGGKQNLTGDDHNDDGGHNMNSKMPLTRNRGRRGNHRRDYRSTRNNDGIRLKTISTPMSSHSMLLGQQQNVEQSPDVRVAHFSTPIVPSHDEMLHPTSFAFPDLVTNGDMDHGVSPMADNDALLEMPQMDSDEEDGPNPRNSINTMDPMDPRDRDQSHETKHKETVVDDHGNHGFGLLGLKEESKERNHGENETQKVESATFQQWDHHQQNLNKKKKSKSNKTNKSKGKRSKSQGLGSMELNRILMNRDDSFDQFNGGIDDGDGIMDIMENEEGNVPIYSKDDMMTMGRGSNSINGDSDEEKDGGGVLLGRKMRRVASDQSGLNKQYGSGRRSKQIIVLNSSKLKVKSPPQIHNKSEFRQMIRPTMSVDAMELRRKREMEQ